MAKTKDELNQLKLEMETMGKKLAELTDDELMQVTGGGKAELIGSVAGVVYTYNVLALAKLN